MPFQKIAPAKKLGGDAFILHGLNKKKVAPYVKPVVKIDRIALL
jgi:hypothetical protein